MSIIKPPYWSTVDLSHPHTDGLVACYNMNDIGSVCADMLTNKHDIELTGTSWVADGLETNASDEYGLIDNSDQIVNSNVCTIVFKFKSEDIFLDGIKQYLFGDSTPGLGQFVAYKDAGGFLVFVFFDTANHYVTTGSFSFPSWDAGTQVALILDRDNIVFSSHKMAVNVDGVHQPVFSHTGTTNWTLFDINTDIRVLSNHTGTVSANGAMEYLRIYNKVLTEEMLKDIYENPYAMMKSKASIISVFFPTFIGGNPWYYNAQQI